jgi:hypothetical protein
MAAPTSQEEPKISEGSSDHTRGSDSWSHGHPGRADLLHSDASAPHPPSSPIAEAALYDRQIRLWGLEAQQRFVRRSSARSWYRHCR